MTSVAGSKQFSSHHILATVTSKCSTCVLPGPHGRATRVEVRDGVGGDEGWGCWEEAGGFSGGAGSRRQADSGSYDSLA